MSAPLIHPWWLAASLVLGSLLFSALGVLVSSLLEPVSAVAALNAARFTLLFLGGALIPKILLPRLLRLAAEALPLIYLVEGFRYGLYNTSELLPPGAAMLVLAGYTFLLLSAGYAALERRLEEA